MCKVALIVAAHPDDEVLGCGGTIAKLCARGTRVHVAFLADGVASRGTSAPDAGELSGRREAANKACAILGAEAPTFGDLPDNRLDTIALLDIVKSVESLIATHKPELILTHHIGDVNVDHKRVHEAVVTACRPQAGHSVKTILCFEVVSSTEWQLPGSAPAFLPNWFEDISEVLDRKCQALQAYAHELRAWPHPRSEEGIRHLAHWRGATVGVDAAEGFVLGRCIA
jgi:LmbE family N-acetylglucosaminyl deacetylase